MEWIGYLASVFIGISLGLIGGGGSILTIPVLVYLFKFPPIEATGYSLFIVGATSLAGAVKNYFSGNVNVKIALSFSIIATIIVLLTRQYILRFIPDELFTIGSFVFTKSFFIMLLFAMLMVVASFKMIFHEAPENYNVQTAKINITKLIFTASGIGFITGLLGAGGGFLIIPSLIFLFHLPMKQAIGTSLFIIAINALSGFAGDVFQMNFNWQLLISITAAAIGGIFIGTALKEKVEADKLKKGFGVFVFIMGVYIIVKEIMSM